MSTFINLYAFISHTTALGPFLRAALWVQGCPFHCAGCMTPAALSSQGGTPVSVSQLAETLIALTDIEGLTITGGEPFAQAAALVELLRQVKKHRNLGIVVYSGYTLHQLQHKINHQANELLQHLDLLIDGQYIRELDDGLSLRGSANQKIHVLTPRYAPLVEKYYGCSHRAVEIQLLPTTVMMVGIPSHTVLQKWHTW